MSVAAAVRRRRVVSRPVGVLLALGVLVASNVLVNRVLPEWIYALWNPAVAGVLVALALWCGVSWDDLGLNRRTLRRGVLVGLVGVASVAAFYALVLAVPGWRMAFDDERATSLGLEAMLWQALVRIPVGTVLLEEVAFRGVLPALLGGGRRWRWWPVLASSTLFGLWHVLPSMRLAGDNAAVREVFGPGSGWVVPVFAVITTTVAGVMLCGWRHAGRGLLPPMMVHLATNSGGVVLAWLLAHGR
jgi:membrane protease YdiL (CAAX protease family)